MKLERMMSTTVPTERSTLPMRNDSRYTITKSAVRQAIFAQNATSILDVREADVETSPFMLSAAIAPPFVSLFRTFLFKDN